MRCEDHSSLLLTSLLNHAPYNCHIPQVLIIVFPRGLHDAGQVSQKGMVYDVLEPSKADIPLPDMPVPVHMASKGRPCIVEVDQAEVFQADLFLKFPEGFLEPFGRR